ncbi:MAG: DUF3352 domain-containing protein [Nostocales cyanobacterium]|nr:MAG: DUF3352 domain-containing protein [Nostocales cyanobacterium]TAF20352.1 MAG: DUF3352 domain-containing protein [Nostocales cyanobacterium]
MNSQRSFFGFLVAGVIAVLLLLITGFYWLFVKVPVKLGTPINQPASAMFVSKAAPVMVSLLVNPEGLQSLDQKGEFSQIKNRLLAKTQVNFAKDVKPWLGDEITLAVTSDDIDHDPSNGIQPGYLMVLATDNPTKSKEFVEVLFSQRALGGANLEVQKYKGVKLIYDTQTVEKSGKAENNLAAAVVDNFVLFANYPKVIREAINNVQAPNVNLKSYPIYQQVIQELPKNALALAFLNLSEVAQWQGLKLTDPTYDSQIISLVLKPQGLLAESTFLSSSPLTNGSQLQAKPVGALHYIPESAGMAVAGTNLSNLTNSNLGKLWQQGTIAIYGSEEKAVERLLKPVVSLQKQWGLNLGSDIFSWVTGEYALAILPNSENADFSWVFVVEKSPELISGLNNLDRIANEQGLNASVVNLRNQKITAWTELTATENQTAVIEAKIKGVHGSIDNYEIFTSDLKVMEKILTHQEKSLIENQEFTNDIKAIPQPNQGYVYVDWEKSQDFLERQQPLVKFVKLLGKPLFDHLQSLTMSSYGEEPEILKGGVFLHLSK